MSRVFGVGKQPTDRTQFKQIEFRNQTGTREGRESREPAAEPSWVLFRAESRGGVQLAHKSKWRQLCTALLLLVQEGERQRERGGGAEMG